MPQENYLTWSKQVINLAQADWDRVNSHSQRRASRIGKPSDAEDFTSSAYLKILERINKGEQVDDLGRLSKRSASQMSFEGAADDLMRVHVSVAPEVDPIEVFGPIDITSRMTELRRTKCSLGQPIFSGRVWRSQAVYLAGHPAILHFDSFGAPKREDVDLSSHVDDEPSEIDDEQRLKLMRSIILEMKRQDPQALAMLRYLHSGRKKRTQAEAAEKFDVCVPTVRKRTKELLAYSWKTHGSQLRFLFGFNPNDHVNGED